MRKFSDTVWIIILLALACITGYLLYTQKIVLFLAPRMTLIAFFGFCVLLGLFVFNLLQHLMGKQKHSSTFKLSYLMFLVPIILFVTASPDEQTIENLPNQSFTLSSGTNSVNEDENSIEEFEGTIEEFDYNEGSNDDMPLTFGSDPFVYNPCILTTGLRTTKIDDQFKDGLYYDLDNMWGKEYTMLGFVMKDDKFPDGVIVVARNIVTCCIADSYPVGFPVRTDDANKLMENQWIVVTGIVDGIEMESYGDVSVYPILTNGTIIKRDTPPANEQYIYP